MSLPHLTPWDLAAHYRRPVESPPQLHRKCFIKPLPLLGPLVDIHALLKKQESEPSPIIYDITTLSSFSRLDATLAYGLQSDTWRCELATAPPSAELVIMSSLLDTPILVRPFSGNYISIWDVLCSVHCAFSPVQFVPNNMWNGLSQSSSVLYPGAWDLHLR